MLPLKVEQEAISEGLLRVVVLPALQAAMIERVSYFCLSMNTASDHAYPRDVKLPYHKLLMPRTEPGEGTW